MSHQMTCETEASTASLLAMLPVWGVNCGPISLATTFPLLMMSSAGLVDGFQWVWCSADDGWNRQHVMMCTWLQFYGAPHVNRYHSCLPEGHTLHFQQTLHKMISCVSHNLNLNLYFTRVTLKSKYLNYYCYFHKTCESHLGVISQLDIIQ